VGVTVRGRSRCEIAAAVQMLASTKRTSKRDAAGGPRRPARCVRSVPGRLPMSSPAAQIRLVGVSR
jgi:hypothetical protein